MEIVLTVLPGVAPALAAELERTGLAADVTADAADEELALDLPGTPESLQVLAELRTAVAAHVVLTSPAPRPTGLTATEVLRDFGAVLALLARQRPRVRFTALRLEAAGSHTPQMQRLAADLAQVAGLEVDPEDGDLLVRVRRARTGTGWEMLVRTTSRPLATRVWRTERYPGALNATIAAAVVQELDDHRDRLGGSGPVTFADLMCGSGTILIERLARGDVAGALAVDVSAEAVATTAVHQRAARARGRVETRVADVADLPGEADLAGGYDVVVANPPWGELLGEHETNDALYARLLDAVDHVGARERLVAGVLTHDIRRFEQVLARDPRWALLARPQYFAKGHRPRLFVLTRA